MILACLVALNPGTEGFANESTIALTLGLVTSVLLRTALRLVLLLSQQMPPFRLSAWHLLGHRCLPQVC